MQSISLIDMFFYSKYQEENSNVTLKSVYGKTKSCMAKTIVTGRKLIFFSAYDISMLMKLASYIKH